MPSAFLAVCKVPVLENPKDSASAVISLDSYHVYQSLQSVPGLRKGMSSVRESEPVKPVPESDIHAVLPVVPGTVATMIQFQLLKMKQFQKLYWIHCILLHSNYQ